MNILVCNAGSTSLKMRLYSMPEEEMLIEKKLERVKNYEAGIREFLQLIDGKYTVDAVGFKTVLSKDHYGVHRIDDGVIQGMKEYMVVAPAHNSFYLEAIETFQKVMPLVPMVGVFETAFHQTMKPEAFLYSVPYEWYEKYGVRKYGYHGASHSYVASVLTKELGEKYKAVSCHLGGSSSLTALVDGKSVDTSFGMSLQCGVPQNNRCGSFDPYLIFFMMKYAGMSADEIEMQLRTQSGLLGVSGVSNDMRDLKEDALKNERSRLAIDMYIREVTGYIGRFAAIMGGLDAVAFTGGTGEKSDLVRSRVMKNLEFLGDVKVFVIPANEELGVARETYKNIIDQSGPGVK